ncbi:MAG TPA: hypothetical protein VKA85_00010 [Candidatus Limnocylindrales bacterium]|nr:hypothetical protein [Candidatus Limnocylindrales bacterium]
MNDRPPEDMADRLHTSHADHDLLLVTAHATGDTLGADAQRAGGLVADCPDCRALAGDLVAIAAATHDLPAVARPRDFTLRREDAARLRPAGWRRLVASLGAARLELIRPVAAGLTTLGLAGILLAGLPLAGGQATGSAAGSGVLSAGKSVDAGSQAASSGGVAAAAPAASAAPSGGTRYSDGGSPGAIASPSGRDTSSEGSSSVGGGPVYGTVASPPASGSDQIRAAAGQPDATAVPELGPATLDKSGTPGVNVPLLTVSSLLLVAGVGLLLLGRAAKNAGGA